MTQHQSTPQNVHLQSLSTTKEEKIPNFHRQNLPYKQLLTIPRARNQTQKESNPCAGLSLSLSLSLLLARSLCFVEITQAARWCVDVARRQMCSKHCPGVHLFIVSLCSVIRLGHVCMCVCFSWLDI